MTFCTKCGTELPLDAKFCPGCGFAVAPPPKQKQDIQPEASEEKVLKFAPAEFESKVFQYIKHHGGELDVEECAKKLEVSEGEIEWAVRSLMEKGRLKK